MTGVRASGGEAAWSLARREVVDFFRARARVVSALMTPILFWAFLGLGFGSSFRLSDAPGLGYEAYFFPGVVALAIVFAGIFSTISTIQDRQTGFLQSVLVAPIPRWSLGVGKMAGATGIAMFQAVVILPLGWAAGLSMGPLALLEAAGILALVAFMMTGLGFFFAWRFDSVQAFHGIMNLVLFPMWALSGALFPAEGAALPLAWAMHANPLFYGLAALRHVLTPEAVGAGAPGLGTSLAVCAGCALAFVVLAARAVGRRAD